jgi:hypothetical protein
MVELRNFPYMDSWSQVRFLLSLQFYKGVLTQLSGSDYIDYEQKQRR